MSEPDEPTSENPTSESPTLDDVIEPTESAPRDRAEHGKAPAHPNDDELEHRTEHERAQAGLIDYVEEEVPPATE